jgi:hypothetical protein
VERSRDRGAGGAGWAGTMIEGELRRGGGGGTMGEGKRQEGGQGEGSRGD